MATHDYVIANQGFPAFRSDLNNALAAIVSNNSSATEPTTMFAHMIWVDTAANPSILKIRNADNDAWITIGSIDQTGDTFTMVNLKTSGPVVFNDAGADVDFRVEGDTDANLLFVDASTDRVGIGLSSPAAKLHIKGAGSYDGIIRVDNSSTTGGGVFSVAQNGSTVGFLTTNGVAQGNTGADLALYSETGKVITFFTNGSNTERMRIDSSGNLLVGATSAGGGTARIYVAGDGTNAGVRFLANTSNTNVYAGVFRHESTTDGAYIEFTTDGGTQTGRIYDSSGTMQYASSSDARLKTNVQPMQNGLDSVLALKPCTFDMRRGESTTIASAGLIAQEVHEIYPYVVGVGGEDENTNPWSVDYGKLTPLLVAAIQELKAELDTVKAELATLKG